MTEVFLAVFVAVVSIPLAAIGIALVFFPPEMGSDEYIQHHRPEHKI